MVNEQGVLANHDEQQMDSENKQRLEEYVVRGYNIIYDKNKAVVNMITKPRGSKPNKIASVANMVSKKIELDNRNKNKPEFSDEVKVIGGYHLVEKMIQLAEHGGVGEFKPEEKQMALQQAYQQYIHEGIQNRTIDPLALAKATEEASPGKVKEALAALPSTPPSSGGGPAAQPPEAAPGAAPEMPMQAGAAPQGPPGMNQPPPQPAQAAPAQQPQQPQGLLTKPTALQQMQGGV